MSSQTVFEISHSCGHEQERDLSETAASLRPKKAEWWETQICTDCLRATPRKRTISKELRAEWNAKRESAYEDQERMNLPPLQGSEKQIPWGTEERFTLLRDAYEELVQSEQLSEDEFDAEVIEPARRIDKARWWIDHKGSSLADLRTDLKDPGEQFLGSENPF
ncbi:hypothetical protein ACFWHR_12230 [Leucobacter sp. NPDC058333]|uniref:hypothetical protein n=1 Tax=Leucobacter sp. NPDC058333 TaxID=3346450 RepID=UPI00365BEAA9